MSENHGAGRRGACLDGVCVPLLVSPKWRPPMKGWLAHLHQNTRSLGVRMHSDAPRRDGSVTHPGGLSLCALRRLLAPRTPAGVLHGLGELSARTAEERRCWGAAKAAGIELVRPKEMCSRGSAGHKTQLGRWSMPRQTSCQAHMPADRRAHAPVQTSAHACVHEQGRACARAAQHVCTCSPACVRDLLLLLLVLLQERRMDPACHKVLDALGMHASTFDCDCVRCKCDLYMSAVVSPDKPGVCACLEHWRDVGVPAAHCVLLFRWGARKGVGNRGGQE